MHNSQKDVSLQEVQGLGNVSPSLSISMLINKLSHAAYFCDADGYIIHYNQQAADLWGSAPEPGTKRFFPDCEMHDDNGQKLIPDELPISRLLKKRVETSKIITISHFRRGQVKVYSNPFEICEGDVIIGAADILTEVHVERSADQSPTLHQEHLQELENVSLYRKMVEEVSDYAIILLNVEGEILNWNKGAEKIKGYSAAEIVGNNFRVFYSAEDRANALPDQLLHEARINGRASHEGWRIKKDGSRFWASIIITAIHGNSGEVIGFSKVTRDLTERKAWEEKQKHYAKELERKNEELLKSEERYHKMIGEVEDYAIILLDAEGHIMNWNKGAESIKGYKQPEVVGRHFSLFYLNDDVEAGLPETLLETARKIGKATHEGWRLKKDGTTFWGSIVITALHDNSHNIIGFSKVTRDLTERKMAEETLERQKAELEYKNELLRRSEERYHRMIAEVEDYAIILLDRTGNILNWNKGAENIKGYKEKEILGKNFNIFYLKEDRDTNLPQRLLEEAVRNNKATHEGWRLRKDGERFWGSIVITALHDDENNIIGFSKVTRDLTQKKKAEDQIESKNKQLEEYAYVASHDLQEPLRKIQIYAELLEETLEDGIAARKNLDKITSSARRMAGLIRDVLDYSQISDAGDLYEEVNLNKVMDDIRIDFEMLLNERGGKLVYSKLPVVRAVPIQMHQLFSNLVNNAIKFNVNAPVVHISSELIHEISSAKRGYYKILVKDNGIGFEPQYSEQIFKMFQRLHGDKKGTGIGLALCRKIAENHNGSINVTSSPGAGTTFEIHLPTYG